MIRYSKHEQQLYDAVDHPIKSGYCYFGACWSERERNFLDKAMTVDENESLFFNVTGNVAKLFLVNGMPIVITSSYVLIYVYEDADSYFFSDNFAELLERFSHRLSMNYKTVFFYVASGQIPPVYDTFCNEIKLIPGSQTAVLDGSEWKFHNYLYQRCGNPHRKSRKTSLTEYASIIEDEANAFSAYSKQHDIHLVATVSGVDSFNAALAFFPTQPELEMIHTGILELQNAYVEEFAKLCNRQDRMRFVDVKYPDIASLNDRYRKYLFPRVHFYTNEAYLDAYRDTPSACLITGDLSGLSMAMKCYSTTLYQHTFWGRHFEGLIRRLRYRDRYIMRMALRGTKGNHNLYNFIKSLQFPQKTFDSYAPFCCLSGCAGLNEAEHKLFNSCMDGYMMRFAETIDWDYAHPSHQGVKILRASKQFFYGVTPAYYKKLEKIYSGVSSFCSFGDNRASVFQLEYALPMRDILSTKVVAYDYFKSRAGTSIAALGKRAAKHVSNRRFGFPIRSALYAAYGPIYDWICKFPRLKNCLAKIKHLIISRPAVPTNPRDKIASLTPSIGYFDLSSSDVACFSSGCSDPVMRQYFLSLEKEIAATDALYFSGAQDRYANLVYYFGSRLPCQRK